MIALVFALSAVILLLLVAFMFSRAAVRRSTEIEASRLAQSMARELKIEAERKVKNAADNAAKEIEHASHEELERIARDLARRN